MPGTPDALALALGADGGAGAVAALVLGAEDVDVLWVAVMLAASPVLELGAVELDEGDVAELELALVLGVGLGAVAALLCALGVVAELTELGALEALVEALWEALALASGVVLGAVAVLEPEVLGAIAEALLSFEDPEEMLALVGLLLPGVELPPALALMVRCSSTFLIPAMDFATSFARFLSAFEETVPVSIAFWFVTDT